MSATQNQRPFFNPGQGIDYLDNNKQEAFSRAQAIDHVFAGSQILTAGGSIAMDRRTAYCPAINSGAVQVSGANFVTAATTIIQYDGGGVIDGQTQHVFMYRIDATEIETALGSAAIPATTGAGERIDLIGVRLSEIDGPQESRDFQDARLLTNTSQDFVTTRRVSASFVYVGGTTSTSPAFCVYPSLPTGYAYLYGFHVSAAGVRTPLDFRTGTRRATVIVNPRQMCASALVNFVDSTNTNTPLYNPDGKFRITTAFGGTVTVPLSQIPSNGRLLRMSGQGLFDAGTAGVHTSRLVKITLAAAPPYTRAALKGKLADVPLDSPFSGYVAVNYDAPLSAGYLPVWGQGGSVPGEEGGNWDGLGINQLAYEYGFISASNPGEVYGFAYEYAF